MSEYNDETGVMRQPCGTWEYHLQLLRRDSEYREKFQAAEAFINHYVAVHADAAFRLSPAIVPVVVHVVYNTSDQNIPDAAVQNQIDALNRDFSRGNADLSTAPTVFSSLAADTGIRFQLAARDPSCQPTTGITRTQTATESFDIFNTDDVKSAATGGANPWPRDKYLNIWVCPALAGQGGRGTFPGASAATDGVIVNYTVFGPGAPPYDLGRVTVHEVGHYFQLFHVFQGACADNDQCADTPPQAAANYGNPTYPHFSCQSAPNGDMFVNHMDYTNDSTKVMFTVDQAARMQATLTGPRSYLLASDGLVPPTAVSAGTLWSADTPRDTAVEPDPLAEPMWQSEDIWVRNKNDGRTVQDHQNPVHRPAGSQPNYVYVRVRNAACGASASGTVKLYWAKASSALAWPAPWDGSVTAPALMGGLIGSQSTGPVPGRGSTVLEFPWSPPDPADYSMFGGDQNHFCLLSRIETAATAPYGMTFAETSNLYENVQNNNKIVWKNVEVATSNHFDMPGFVTVGNLHASEREVLVAVHAPSLGGKDAWGHVELEVPNELADKLRNADLDPTVASFEKDTLRIHQLDTPIGPVTIDGGQYYTLGVQVVADTEAPPFGLFLIDVNQYERRDQIDVLTGGQRVAFKVLPPRQGDKEALLGRWWHSHEEDQADIQVFRPEGYEFPVSLGRWGLELQEDHRAVVFDIGAAEGVERVDGYWWTDHDDRIHIGLGDPDRGDLALRVHSVDKESLVLRRARIDLQER
ncbi:zinc metalloprotease [Streptomyces sp. NPDC127063]|uniref:zinc metalloprotease n=1 Tax=Streptomyces sp. NPDC127063 TaxID=3347123 RepID=UPI00364E3197